MTINEYQEFTNTTAANHGKTDFMWLTYCILGLAGEAGEVAVKFKKIIRDDNLSISDEKRKELKSELGDNFWYLAQVAKGLGYTLDEIAQDNKEKLLDRQKRGVISGSGDNR